MPDVASTSSIFSTSSTITPSKYPGLDTNDSLGENEISVHESDESHSDSNEGRMMKKRRKRSYVQAFKKEWKIKGNIEWLEEKGNGATCKICDVNIKGGITHIKRHGDSDRHKKKMKIVSSTPQVTNFLKTNNKQEERLKTSVKKAEIKMVMLRNIIFLLRH